VLGRWSSCPGLCETSQSSCSMTWVLRYRCVRVCYCVTVITLCITDAASKEQLRNAALMIHWSLQILAYLTLLFQMCRLCSVKWWNGIWTKNSKGCRGKRSWHILRCSQSISVECLSKTIKISVRNWDMPTKSHSIASLGTHLMLCWSVFLFWSPDTHWVIRQSSYRNVDKVG
jgi:hypothetical protein